MDLKFKPIICYLCGHLIVTSEEHSFDHVPPKNFFPKNLRKKINLSQLITLSSHKSCNQNYSSDEEYFRVSLGFHADGSFAGKELWNDIGNNIERKSQTGHMGLSNKIISEFRTQTLNGIYLPFGSVAKYFDSLRVNRVVWKITRGIFFNLY